MQVNGNAPALALFGAVKDLAGNAMGADHVFTFAVAAPWVRISGDSDPVVGNAGVAFDTGGDGVAAWTSGTNVVISTYSSATSTWSPPSALASGTAVTVVAAHSGFLALWTGGGLKAALVQAGTAGTPVTVSSSGSTPIAAASNGTGYAVLYGGSDTGSAVVHARTFDGSSWSAAARLLATSVIGDAAVASDGSGYLASVAYSGGVWVYRFVPGSSWTGLGAASSYQCWSTAVGSNSAGYLVAWAPNETSYPVRAAFVTGSTIASSSILRTGSAIGSNVAVASDGAGYLVAWSQSGLYAATHDGVAWSTAAQVSSNQYVRGLAARAGGGRYALAYVLGTFAGSPARAPP